MDFPHKLSMEFSKEVLNIKPIYIGIAEEIVNKTSKGISKEISEKKFQTYIYI